MTTKTKAPSFAVSARDATTIRRIAERAMRMGILASVNRLHFEMDLTACHANGNPLRLHDLLAAHDADFAHDVGGIRRHIDRETGKLMDCFEPRYSRREGS